MIALSVTAGSQAKISFERTYGGADFDYGRCVVQTGDGGYAVTGETHSFGVGWGDAYLVRVDSMGDTLWSSTYGGSMYDCGRGLVETGDGGFLIVGETQSFGAGGNDVYLIRTDSMGGLLWSAPFGGGEYDCGYSVHETADGFVIAGETGSSGAGGQDAYLLKVDIFGNFLWDRTYGGGGFERAFSVDETPDGGFVIAGQTSSFGAGGDDMYLVVTDDSGVAAWSRTYGSSSTDWARSAERRSDGGYVVGGETRASGMYDLYLVRTDSLGIVMLETFYGGASHDRCMSMQQTIDGGCVMVGYTQSFGAGDYDVYVVAVDSAGDTIWTRTYGGAAEDRGGFVQQTQDTGFIITGYTESFGAGGYDVYLIKVGPDGVVAKYDCTVVTIDSPADTVLKDSTYAVAATVQNLSNVTSSFDVVARIDGYEDTVRVTDLPPGSALVVSFENWQVSVMDSATYSMTVCAHVAGDLDSTNDCRAKSIFAYDPMAVAELRARARAGGGVFSLDGNAPNPFSAGTVISYSLPEPSDVSLLVFDASGRLVEKLREQRESEGRHSVEWKPRGLAGGIYFCVLRAGDATSTMQMVLAR